MSRLTGLMWNYLPLATWAVDAALSAAIVLKVPYTEIDWKAYMQQIDLIKGGESTYSNISGDTGPLVYPGGHVLIYELLYDFCGGGKDIRKAQWIFYGVYLATLAIVFAIYRKAKIGTVYLLPLILSKRLHSIYLLRLFNDCFMTFFAALAVYALQHRRFATSSVLFSVAVSIKMGALLFLPGAALVYISLMGFWPSACLSVPFVLIQMLLAAPFKANITSYLAGAFNFSRSFEYKWTVNWRFIEPQMFGSQAFAQTLLAAHLGLLTLLAGFTSSLKHSISLSKASSNSSFPRWAARVVFISNLIGVLCARSLHYQFYAWFYWTVPFLLADVPWPFKFAWLALEYSWNVYPSTITSSAISLTSIIILIFFGLAALRRDQISN